MVNDRAIRFFEHVILKYNRGDVRKLLDLKLEEAGPLLACVVNGIDAMGGMIVGFGKGSAERSKKFILNYMGLPQYEADLLYSVVRCGMAHECVPKLCLKFFVQYSSKGDILYSDGNGVLWLDVTQFAKDYLRAIEKIDASHRADLQHVPVCKSSDANTFGAVLDSSLPSIDNLCATIAEDIRPAGSSCNPFFAEWLPTMEIPPAVELAGEDKVE